MAMSTGSTVRVGLVTGALLLLLCGGRGGERVLAAAPINTPHLDTVLRQMDAASKSFKSAQANIRREIFTKVVNDTDEQTGIIYFLRKGGTTQMGMKMTSPPEQVMEYKDGKVRVYTPGTKHLDEVSAAGDNKARFDTFLTLGFGGSGRDLESAWTIQDDGTESVSDGEKMVSTEKLDLVSNDPDVKKTVSRVTIWMDPVRDVSLKQILYFPNGNSQTAFYSKIVQNKSIDMKPFTIPCKDKCS